MLHHIAIRQAVRTYFGTLPALKNNKVRVALEEMPWLIDLLPLGKRVDEVSVRRMDDNLVKEDHTSYLMYLIGEHGKILSMVGKYSRRGFSDYKDWEDVLAQILALDARHIVAFVVTVHWWNDFGTCAIQVIKMPKTEPVRAFAERILAERRAERQQKEQESEAKERQELDEVRASIRD